VILKSLHGVLDQLYDDQMIPMCSQLIGVGRIYRWLCSVAVYHHTGVGHISQAEPVILSIVPTPRDWFCNGIFPSVIALINGVMKPTSTGTWLQW